MCSLGFAGCCSYVMSETGRFLDAALAGEKILGLTTKHAATPGVKLAVAFRQLSAALEIDNFQTAFVWVCRLRVFITSSSSRIKVLRYRGVTQWRTTTTQKERKKKNSMMSGDRVMIPTRHEDPYRRRAKHCESFFFQVLVWVVDMWRWNINDGALSMMGWFINAFVLGW